MILINTEFLPIIVLTIPFVSCVFGGSVCSEAWKMGAKLRGLCTEIIAGFLVHAKPVIAMTGPSCQYIHSRELCAFEGCQREILALTPCAWMRVGGPEEMQ